jgi:hypothetical protein
MRMYTRDNDKNYLRITKINIKMECNHQMVFNDLIIDDMNFFKSFKKFDWIQVRLLLQSLKV